MAHRIRADAVHGVLPGDSPFVGPFPLLHQDLDSTEAARTIRTLKAEGELIGENKHHVVGELA